MGTPALSCLGLQAPLTRPSLAPACRVKPPPAMLAGGCLPQGIPGVGPHRTQPPTVSHSHRAHRGLPQVQQSRVSRAHTCETPGPRPLSSFPRRTAGDRLAATARLASPTVAALCPASASGPAGSGSRPAGTRPNVTWPTAGAPLYRRPATVTSATCYSDKGEGPLGPSSSEEEAVPDVAQEEAIKVEAQKGAISVEAQQEAVEGEGEVQKGLPALQAALDVPGSGTENLVKAENDFFMFTGYLAKYMFVMLTSGAALETFVELAGGGQSRGAVLWFCWFAGSVLGSMVGARKVLDGYARCGPRNVVVTGSTRGLGKALAREFLVSGDNVVVTSRRVGLVACSISGDDFVVRSSEAAVAATVKELRENMAALGRTVPQAALWQAPKEGNAQGPVLFGRTRTFLCEDDSGGAGDGGALSCGIQKVVGLACDVQQPDEVRALAEVAHKELGDINIWINNAGANTGAKPFLECRPEEVQQVVATNLVGSMLCTREAFSLLKSQPSRGHIFNMEGAGSEGGATPQYAIYGSTKSALRQFHSTLLQELRGSGVGIHTASPGMVLTDLLLSGVTPETKQAFNFVCEQPETVARALVPRMRAVRGTGKAINYLTPPRIVFAVITAWLRRGRWFDEEGRAVYAVEADRLRALAEGRQQQSPLAAVLEALPSTAWVSLFTSSAIGVYLVVTSISGANPG